MSALHDGLKRIVLQFAAGAPHPTLGLLLRACGPSYSGDEVSKAVDELVAENRLAIEAGLENVGGELTAIVKLRIP